MELRRQKAAGRFIALALLLAPAVFAAEPELRFDVRHDHLRSGGPGTLTITKEGLSFAEAKKNKHAWNWRWDDIQQLEMAPRTVRVLTYKDSAWKLGADKEYRFDLLSGGTFAPAYEFLKNRLDQRFVAAIVTPGMHAEWELPAKHLKRFGGTDGVLAFGRDQIAFITDKRNESRTWRFRDIDNISTAGPFQLTVTTYERAVMSYGDLKSFNFQLKRPLDERRYDELWRRLNAAKSPNLNSNNTERKDLE